MPVRIDIGEYGNEEPRFLSFRGQCPSLRLTEPLDPIDERCVRPVLFWKPLKDDPATGTAPLLFMVVPDNDEVICQTGHLLVVLGGLISLGS